MKKIVLVFFCFLCTWSYGIAQKAPKLQKKISLTIPSGDDEEKTGTRGASVAWNPVTKKYYANMAGNAAFPMAVFDIKGKRLSTESQTCLVDTRGLWYDPAKKTVCGNGYDENGWFSYKLDAKGLIKDVTTDITGMNQPSDNATGTFNAAAKKVYFLKGSMVSIYNMKAVLEDVLVLHIGRKQADGPAENEGEESAIDGYNNTTMIYTGIKNKEFGLLNAQQKQLEFYDSKTGYLTQILLLPDTAPAWEAFNFSYANGYYWLFNQDTRTWEGYK